MKVSKHLCRSWTNSWHQEPFGVYHAAQEDMFDLDYIAPDGHWKPSGRPEGQ